MATAAERELARQMFNVYATGFDPGETGINFWADKIANQGFDSAFAEFINPPQGPSAPRFATMSADPDYMAAIRMDTPVASFLSGNTFEPTFDNGTRTVTIQDSNAGGYPTYTEPAYIPQDIYVEPTYTEPVYMEPAVTALEPTFGGGTRNVTMQDANLGGTYVADGRGNIVDAAGNIVGTDTGATNVANTATTAAPAFTAQDLFDVYVTGYTPDQAALDFWNNKIATMSPEAVLNEFLNPSDIYAPRTDVMFADPDYIRAGGRGRPTTTVTDGGGRDTFDNGGRDSTMIDGGGGITPPPAVIPPTVTPPTVTPPTVTPPGSNVTAPPLSQEGMATYGGLNFFGTPMQQGFYSERGFEPGYLPFGQSQDAMGMFSTFATGFTPDQAALNFWNNKIATMGYSAALNEFLNPSDVNAPRNQVMFADPEYMAQQSGGFVNTVMPTFRSGVSGYTPMVPTGFQFGTAPVTAPRYVFTPGAFNPGYINEAGEWFPTAPGEAASPMAPGTIRTGNRANEAGSEYDG